MCLAEGSQGVGEVFQHVQECDAVEGGDVLQLLEGSAMDGQSPRHCPFSCCRVQLGDGGLAAEALDECRRESPFATPHIQQRVCSGRQQVEHFRARVLLVVGPGMNECSLRQQGTGAQELRNMLPGDGLVLGDDLTQGFNGDHVQPRGLTGIHSGGRKPRATGDMAVETGAAGIVDGYRSGASRIGRQSAGDLAARGQAEQFIDQVVRNEHGRVENDQYPIGVAEFQKMGRRDRPIAGACMPPAIGMNPPPQFPVTQSELLGQAQGAAIEQQYIEHLPTPDEAPLVHRCRKYPCLVRPSGHQAAWRPVPRENGPAQNAPHRQVC
ncbi:MAG: hypothetical protein AW09_002711 [Candidatus Accumulibacter phosphatis]|uniref:Uncharacterized protein n=1 Tax=Candidatus Accumulibacter phosphatis TaxID=327160 RepID=A0A080LUF3_9PROT|nr:MAG: hypothetical protein AW09_002711 [Candidatus Accumulibacter phosphatis]